MTVAATPRSAVRAANSSSRIGGADSGLLGQVVVARGRRVRRRRALSASASSSTFDRLSGADRELLDRIRDDPRVTVGPDQADGKLSVVFASSEVAPWSKTGGLGDVCGALPSALANRGHRVMVVSPLYRGLGPFDSTGVTVEIDGTIFYSVRFTRDIDEHSRRGRWPHIASASLAIFQIGIDMLNRRQVDDCAPV